jgi:hypothetical protein
MEKGEANFETRIDGLIEMIEPEGHEVHPTVRSLAMIALHSVEIKYGENSDNPLPQHNVEHAINVTERAIELTNLLYEYIPEEYRENIYELALLAGIAHDWEQLQGVGANEQASADYLIGLIEQTGNSPINTDRFKQRAGAGVMATEYEFDEEAGVINQINLLKDEPYEEGKPDPLRFIMAFADINAIAMKGPNQMYEDVTRLFFERNMEDPTEEGLREMLDYQEKFIRSQLNDHRIKAYIARYFPDYESEAEDEDNEVYTVMKNAYNQNIRDSYENAQWLKRSSDVVVKELKGILHTVDIHVIASRLSKIVHLGKRH